MSGRDGEKNSSHTKKVGLAPKQSGPHDIGYICGLFGRYCEFKWILLFLGLNFRFHEKIIKVMVT